MSPAVVTGFDPLDVIAKEGSRAKQESAVQVAEGRSGDKIRCRVEKHSLPFRGRLSHKCRRALHYLPSLGWEVTAFRYENPCGSDKLRPRPVHSDCLVRQDFCHSVDYGFHLGDSGILPAFPGL